MRYLLGFTAALIALLTLIGYPTWPVIAFYWLMVSIYWLVNNSSKQGKGVEKDAV